MGIAGFNGRRGPLIKMHRGGWYVYTLLEDGILMFYFLHQGTILHDVYLIFWDF